MLQLKGTDSQVYVAEKIRTKMVTAIAHDFLYGNLIVKMDEHAILKQCERLNSDCVLHYIRYMLHDAKFYIENQYKSTFDFIKPFAFGRGSYVQEMQERYDKFKKNQDFWIIEKPVKIDGVSKKQINVADKIRTQMQEKMQAEGLRHRTYVKAIDQMNSITDPSWFFDNQNSNVYILANVLAFLNNRRYDWKNLKI